MAEKKYEWKAKDDGSLYAVCDIEAEEGTEEFTDEIQAVMADMMKDLEFAKAMDQEEDDEK